MKNFNWNRFCKVVADDARSLWPRFGLSMLIITLLPIAWWLLNLVMDTTMEIQPEIRATFIAFNVFVVTVFAPSRMYKTCNMPKKGIHFAMLPASKCEKFWSMVLFTLIVCPLLCFAGSIVLDVFLRILPFGGYTEWIPIRTLWAESGMLTDEFSPYGTMMILNSLTSYLLLSALFFFTNTIFLKHKVLKTFLWGLLIIFVGSLIITPIAMHIDWQGIALWIDLNVDAFTKRMMVAGLVLDLLIAIGLYVWSYFRLKKMRY